MAVPKIETRVNVPIDADKVKKTKRTAKTKPTKARSEVKTKRATPKDQKKKKRIYTAEELGIPKLNGIVPNGVQKPKGKKKGKIFVDDAKSMMAILGMVQAEKEGEVEGKMVKARQLEEIREAKRVEAEQRFEARKEKLVCIRVYVLSI
jgi:60S ribosomal subunit assembly/export protein LOC1